MLFSVKYFLEILKLLMGQQPDENFNFRTQGRNERNVKKDQRYLFIGVLLERSPEIEFKLSLCPHS